MPRRRPDGIRQPIAPRRHGSHADPLDGPTTPTRRHKPPPRHPQNTHARARPRIPELHRATTLRPKRKQLVRGIDVDDIDARNVAAAAAIVGIRQTEGRHEPPLVEVEAVHLVARRPKVRIARRKVVRERPPKFRDPRAVVKPALRVQLDRAVGLEVYGFGPVVREDLFFFDDR